MSKMLTKYLLQVDLASKLSISRVHFYAALAMKI